jgi:hypothetical protein
MKNLYCELCDWTGEPKLAKYTVDFDGDDVLTCPNDCQIYDYQFELEVMDTVDSNGNKLLWYDYAPVREYVYKELKI